MARGLSVTKVRKRLQTVAFLVPAAALTVLVNPSISQVLAVACMTTALGVSSLGACFSLTSLTTLFLYQPSCNQDSCVLERQLNTR